MGKKTLNDFFKFGDFFYVVLRVLPYLFFFTAYSLTHLTISAEDLLLLHPLIARLSTETAAFVSFRLLPRQHVCFWMHSHVHFCFSSLSFSPSSASPSFVVARRGLLFTHFCFSRHRSPFSHLFRLPVAIVSFLVVLLFRHRPLIHSLQVLVTIVGLPLVYFSFS